MGIYGLIEQEDSILVIRKSLGPYHLTLHTESTISNEPKLPRSNYQKGGHILSILPPFL